MPRRPLQGEPRLRRASYLLASLLRCSRSVSSVAVADELAGDRTSRPELMPPSVPTAMAVADLSTTGAHQFLHEEFLAAVVYMIRRTYPIYKRSFHEAHQPNLLSSPTYSHRSPFPTPPRPALTSPKKPSSMENAGWAIAFLGLWAAISAIQISPYLDHLGSNMDGAQAPLLDAAVLEVVLPLAAIQAFLTAVTFIYVHIHNGGGGGAGAVNRRIPEVVTFILSVSIGLLELFLFPQTGAIDDGVQATPLGAAAAHALLPSATATFFLAMTLIYVHVRTGDGGGANGPVRADVELLTNMTLGATLFSLVAIVLAVYTSAR